MERIRQASHLARFVLVWFVMSVGIAMASPWVSPKSIDMVCTASGAMKLVASDDADTAEQNVHTMDCALCMAVGIPPASIKSQFTKPSPLSHALNSIEAAHIAAATAPPFPSRGPPAL